MEIKYFMKTILIAFVTCCMPVLCQAAIEPDGIEISNGHISIDVNQVPLKNVITKISEKAGVNIYIFDDSEGKYLTAEFSERPLESGIRSILKGVSYAIVYQGNHKSGIVQWIKNADNRPLLDTISSRTVLAENRSNNNNPQGLDASSYALPESDRIQPVTQGVNSKGVFMRDKLDLTNTLSDTSADNQISVQSDTKFEGEEIFDEQQGILENINNNDTNDEVNIAAVEEETSKKGLPSWYKGNMSKEEGRLRYRIEKLEKDIENGYADNHYDRWVAIKGTKMIRLPDENLADYKNRLLQLLGN